METGKHRLRARTTADSRSGISLADQSTWKNSGMFGPTAVPIPTLTFLSGDALGKELPLVKERLTLGRGEESDVLIMDPSVSRKHIQLICRKLIGKEGNQNLKVILQDLGSKNGTLVNYRRVRRVILKPGDKICIGKVILKFEYRDIADQSFYDEIYRLATVDSLTSLLNKASVTRALAEELTKKFRYPGALSILLIDIDDFKSLNDMHGHLLGDRALQAIGEILRRNLRKPDRAGRFGGDEFLVILPETGSKGAATLAERLRTDLERATAAEVGLPGRVTGSIGVATYPADGNTCESLLEHVDVAVYRAKARGKNRVEPYKPGKHSTDGQA